MRIKLLRNTVVNGQAASVGDVVETDARQATYLIAVRKAVPIKEEPEQAIVKPEEQTTGQAAMEDPDALTTQDAPVIEQSEQSMIELPRRKGRKAG